MASATPWPLTATTSASPGCPPTPLAAKPKPPTNSSFPQQMEIGGTAAKWIQANPPLSNTPANRCPPPQDSGGQSESGTKPASPALTVPRPSSTPASIRTNGRRNTSGTGPPTSTTSPTSAKHFPPTPDQTWPRSMSPHTTIIFFISTDN